MQKTIASHFYFYLHYIIGFVEVYAKRSWGKKGSFWNAGMSFDIIWNP